MASASTTITVISPAATSVAINVQSGFSGGAGEVLATLVAQQIGVWAGTFALSGPNASSFVIGPGVSYQASVNVGSTALTTPSP